MAEQNIELRKIRDFGENMNDAFLFIRQNFRPLIKSFLAICAVFMLAQAIFNGMYQSRSMAFFKDIFSGQRGNANSLSKVFSIEYFLMILSAWLTFAAINVALGGYIKYYAQNNGTPPTLEEVWTIFKKYFFVILLYTVPVYFIIVVGCFFCLLPGIYLWVVFVPFSLVVIFEERSFGDAFGRCFDLIRENFWSSFAIYLVSYIIYSICGLLIGGIVSALVALAGYLTTDDLGTSYAVLTSFLNIFSFCFYIIFFVSAALNYFSLVEIKEGTGILNRIDNIGKNKDNFDNIEEQY